MWNHKKISERLLWAADQIELAPKRRTAAWLNGAHLSRHRGPGMQFKEFRNYEPGDDIRHVSWTVTARTGKTALKTFEEERELNVILAIDVSGSSLYGATTKRKVDMYGEVMTVLGLSAQRTNDNFGTLFFSDKVEHYAPPARGRMALGQNLDRLLHREFLDKQSDVRPAIEFLASALKAPSIVIFLSDFVLPEFDREIIRLREKHELIFFRGYDDSESRLFSDGVLEVCDPESGATYLVDTQGKQTRKALTDYYRKLETSLDTLTARLQARYLGLSVQDDYVQRLVHFFRQRLAA